MKICVVHAIGVIVMSLIVGCVSSKPTSESKTINHNGCWYRVHRYVKSIQYPTTIVDIYEDTWEARCNEDYLARLKRERCTILSVSPTTVVVSGCKAE